MAKKKMDNAELFGYCLTRQELLADPHFGEMNPFIITESKAEKNDLIRAYYRLNELIVCYKVALDDGDVDSKRKHLKKIIEELKHTNINYAEFPSFWNALGSTFSMYERMSDSEKEEFVKQALEIYIEKRYDAYRSHGTSPVILQVNCDSYAHKRNSSYATKKVEKILLDKGYEHFDVRSMSANEACVEFMKKDNVFKVTHSSQDPFYCNFLEYIKEKSEFWYGRRNKAPDFVIKKDKSLYIVEHKHLKEGGGGQDKQMDELIEFVSQKPSIANLHYVSYLDGYYFNTLIKKELERVASPKKRATKPQIQLSKIREALSKYKTNYFVNTAGFNELFHL